MSKVSVAMDVQQSPMAAAMVTLEAVSCQFDPGVVTSPKLSLAPESTGSSVELA